MNILRKIYRTLSPKFQKLFLEYKVKFEPRYGHGKPPHEKLYAIINLGRKRYEKLLHDFLANHGNLKTLQLKSLAGKESDPAWVNGYFPGLDTIVLYQILRNYKPKSYIEIGSGNSTKVARKSIRDHSLGTKIISIDPFPRAEIDALADQVIRQPVENIDFSEIIIEPGDILFIDNSHRAFPNSDVTVCFLEIIPNLPVGTIVHIHDIYLPYDYPQFMADRFYSEQYLLATMLLSNPDKYEVIAPNYFISEDNDLKKILDPFWDSLPASIERHGGSFWFLIK